MNANGLPRGGIRDNCENLLPLAGFVLGSDAAVDADGNLAAATKRGQRSAFSSDGVAGRGIVKKGDGSAGVRIAFAYLNAERPWPAAGQK